MILQMADLAAAAFKNTWLPLVIWTLLSSLAWFVLRIFDNTHPFYQYHTRLALIFSLPAGLLLLALIHTASGWFFSASPEASLTFITLTNPLDIAFTPIEESSGIPMISMIHAMLFFLFSAGVTFFIGRFIIQAVQLKKLRQRCLFEPVTELDQLSAANLGLAISTRKRVQVSFLETDIVPVTFGFRNPVILLPESLRNQPGKLNLAIRHELTHITQHDFFSHLMVILTEALFWFHPLVHRLKHELVEYRELRCDHLVLSEKSISRKEYASLLLELIPMTNIDKELSVNMAQETSNLKKRIQMIAQQNLSKPIPKKSSLAIFGAIILCTAIAMACTDMQTQDVFDNEELDLMTNVDVNGERGYHQILIFLGDEDQANRHMNALDQLIEQDPGHIISINVLNNEPAIEKYGERGSKGVIEINTSIFPEAYNAVLKTLGMESQDQSELWYEEPAPVRINVDQMPELIGGIEALQREIRYPEMARQAGIEGRVFVQFIVDQEGNVELPTIIRGIGGGADEEVLRVISQAKFKPAISEGRPVRVKYSLPVTFRLPEKERDESTQSESVNSLPDNLKDAINVIGYMPLD